MTPLEQMSADAGYYRYDYREAEPLKPKWYECLLMPVMLLAIWLICAFQRKRSELGGNR